MLMCRPPSATYIYMLLAINHIQLLPLMAAARSTNPNIAVPRYWENSDPYLLPAEVTKLATHED